jgi:hypothetical protein
MNELIAVHSPIAVLAGDVTIISVEIWMKSVFVHLATDRQGDAVWLNRIDLTVADDTGTVYEPRESSAGGTGSEMRAMWRFEPGVPPQASRLTIAIGAEGVEVAL